MGTRRTRDLYRIIWVSKYPQSHGNPTPQVFCILTVPRGTTFQRAKTIAFDLIDEFGVDCDTCEYFFDFGRGRVDMRNLIARDSQRHVGCALHRAFWP